MLSRIAPIQQRLRHLHLAISRPAAFRSHAADEGGDLTAGQRLAEHAAGAIGSWRFIGAQAVVMALWIVLNTAIVLFRWDAYPFVFLNLAMSAEAAFTGPVLLIAANVGAQRDHAQAARMERLEAAMAARLDGIEHRLGALVPPAELPVRRAATSTPRKPTTPAKTASKKEA